MVHMTEIMDFSAKELDVYARLTEAQLLNKDKPEEGMFIAESPKVIERALNAGYQPVSVLVEKRQAEQDEESRRVLLKCGECGEVPVYMAEFEVLTQLTGFKLTRGMLCAMRRKNLPDVKTVCEGAKHIVVLENVMNPTNVGAIFRSAAALNMDAILLTPGCSNPLYRRASRVSMGTTFQIPWTFVDNFENQQISWQKEGLHILKELGFRTAALALTDESVSIDDSQLMSERKLAVILGNEGNGLEAKTIATCDYTVKIPMSHGVDSLNVAAASAVAFWQLGRSGESLNQF